MSDIINLRNYTDALRNTGYKNTESALSEIVDNSIEAGAENVMVTCKTNLSTTGREVVDEIAILDNGHGMSKDELWKCLSIGESTRRSRKGMGRFGVGLPQASLHVAPRVEVYSWQDSGPIQMVCLDTNKIKAGEMVKIAEPIQVDSVPEIYTYLMSPLEFEGHKLNFSKSGTLVVWKGCDRLKPKSTGPLFERFKFLLGRKFRHFINEGCTITFSVIGKDNYDFILKPNDPLYLMKNNQVLGNTKDPEKVHSKGQPIFELWGQGDKLGTIEHAVKYLDSSGDPKESIVKITFSLAKPEYQVATGGKAKGGSAIGQHCKKNVGISIVRANREIDFAKFDFFEDVNQPQHRWWGCEVRFTPELDEVFGVANNKQQVELYELDPADYDDEEVMPMWLQLYPIINREIKNMYGAIKERGQGTRKNKASITSEETVVKSIEKDAGSDTASGSARIGLTEAERINLYKEKLLELGVPDPSENEVKAVMQPVVKIEKQNLGDTSAFIDISTKMGTCWLTINTGSIFYRELYSKIEEHDNEEIRAMNLILMAFARAEDEAYRNPGLYEAFKEVREQWGFKLSKYLKSDYQA